SLVRRVLGGCARIDCVESGRFLTRRSQGLSRPRWSRLYRTGPGRTSSKFESLKESVWCRRAAGFAGVAGIAGIDGMAAAIPERAAGEASIAGNGIKRPDAGVARLGSNLGKAGFAGNVSVPTKKPLAGLSGICEVAGGS